MEIGNSVRLIQPVVKGEIKDTEYDKGEKQLRHLVEWKDESGDVHTRWFNESQLEVVKNAK